MKSWEDIGNTDAARKLIAAAIRTCKVARYLCEQTKIITTSYWHVSRAGDRDFMGIVEGFWCREFLIMKYQSLADLWTYSKL